MALRSEAKACRDHAGIALGMGQPRLRCGREVGVVVGKQLAGTGVVLGLHQPAAVADVQFQGKVTLRRPAGRLRADRHSTAGQTRGRGRCVAEVACSAGSSWRESREIGCNGAMARIACREVSHRQRPANVEHAVVTGIPTFRPWRIEGRVEVEQLTVCLQNLKTVRASFGNDHHPAVFRAQFLACHFRKVGDRARRSTATSHTRPLRQRTSFISAWGGYCRCIPRTAPTAWVQRVVDLDNASGAERWRQFMFAVQARQCAPVVGNRRRLGQVNPSERGRCELHGLAHPKPRHDGGLLVPAQLRATRRPAIGIKPLIPLCRGGESFVQRPDSSPTQFSARLGAVQIQQPGFVRLFTYCSLPGQCGPEERHPVEHAGHGLVGLRPRTEVPGAGAHGRSPASNRWPRAR